MEAIQQLFEANGVNVDLDLALFQANHGDDSAAAVELARHAYESEPNIKAADALGWALYADGQYDEARRYAEEALRLGTPYGSFLYHAGMIAQAQGDHAAARDFLSRALEQDPYFSPLFGPRARAALAELVNWTSTQRSCPKRPACQPVATSSLCRDCNSAQPVWTEGNINTRKL